MESALLEYPAVAKHQRRIPYVLACTGLALLLAAAWLAWRLPDTPPLSGALESTPWGWRLRFSVEMDQLPQVRRYRRAYVFTADKQRIDGHIDRLAGVWDGGRHIEIIARFLPDESLEGPTFEPATVVLE